MIQFARLLIIILLSVTMRSVFIQAFRIPTGSMKDTIIVGDFLLVNKFIYGFRTSLTQIRIMGFEFEIPVFRVLNFNHPRRGDIVVFKYPENPEFDYIKRCVAVEGDTIQIRKGDVFVNGFPEGKKVDLGRKYDPEDGKYVNRTKITTANGKEYIIRHYVDRYNQTENFGPVTVPKGHYFMMGDNRDNSADSRSWGFLPRENVTGKAFIIYFSWDKANSLFRSIRWFRIGVLID